MEFKPSVYQSAIFDAVKYTNDSLLIQAVAGSGKSTTIVEASKMISKDKLCLFLAFNRSIKEELEERLPNHFSVSTMNGLGHGAWARHARGVKLHKGKVYDILKSRHVTKKFGQAFTGKNRRVVSEIVSMCKQLCIVPKRLPQRGLGYLSVEVLDAICEHYGIDIADTHKAPKKAKLEEIAAVQASNRENVKKVYKLANFVLRENIKKTKVIDFGDQLYLPVINRVPFKKYDIVFVDEAQDISDIQRVMIKNSLKPNGRLIVVGDSNQAIYGWRGANADAMQTFKEQFKLKELPLSISYRCPKEVVELAKEIVPDIECSDNAIKGAVVEYGEYETSFMNPFKPKTLVVCRNNAPLVKCALHLLSIGKSCYILDSTIPNNVRKVLSEIKPSSLGDLTRRLDDYENYKIKSIKDQDPYGAISFIKDQCDTVRYFLDMENIQHLDDIEDFLDEFDKRDENAVMLTSVHKAKGLEADRVILLDRHLIPSKHAKKSWQRNQEDNLLYVAITRAKKELILVTTPKDKEDDDNEELDFNIE